MLNLQLYSILCLIFYFSCATSIPNNAEKSGKIIEVDATIEIQEGDSQAKNQQQTDSHNEYSTHHNSTVEFKKQQAHKSDQEIFSQLCQQPVEVMFEVTEHCQKYERAMLNYIKAHGEKHDVYNENFIENSLHVLPKEFICFEHELHRSLWECMCKFCSMPMFASIERPESLYYKFRVALMTSSCNH